MSPKTPLMLLIVLSLTACTGGGASAKLIGTWQPDLEQMEQMIKDDIRQRQPEATDQEVEEGYQFVVGMLDEMRLIFTETTFTMRAMGNDHVTPYTVTSTSGNAVSITVTEPEQQTEHGTSTLPETISFSVDGDRLTMPAPDGSGKNVILKRATDGD